MGREGEGKGMRWRETRERTERNLILSLISDTSDESVNNLQKILRLNHLCQRIKKGLSYGTEIVQYKIIPYGSPVLTVSSNNF